MSDLREMKNVLVLGGSYAGGRAARLLSQQLPPTHRVILVDRNSHHNHLYVFPRYAVVKGHQHKAFIPYAKFDNKKTDSASEESRSLKGNPLSRPHLSDLHRVDSTSNILLNSGPQNPTHGSDHLILHASVEKINSNSIKLSRGFPEFGLNDEVQFEYLVYALGSIMPRSLEMDSKTLQSGTKQSGTNWLEHRQRVIENNNRIVIAGGGALGIQLASDIKNTYPTKDVTLIHSRNRLLPRFDPQMHDIIMESLIKLGVDCVLEDRIELNNATLDFDGHVEQKRVFTRSGRRIECDLVVSWRRSVCTHLSNSFHSSCAPVKDQTLTFSNNSLHRLLTPLQTSQKLRDQCNWLTCREQKKAQKQLQTQSQKPLQTLT